MLCWFLPYNSVNQPYITFSRIWFSVTPWTAACQASLSITNSGACSNSCLSSQWCHPTTTFPIISFSCCLQSLPASGSFVMSCLFTSGGQSIGALASVLVLPMNIEGWFLLRLTYLISLLSKRLSESSPAPQFKSINSSALSLYGPTLTSIHDYWKSHCFDYTDLCLTSIDVNKTINHYDLFDVIDHTTPKP